MSKLPDPAPRNHAAPALLLVGMVLVALNLRPVIAAFGPLLAQIQRDLGVGAATVSLLTTIPLLCWGALALLAPALTRARSAEVVILGCLGLIGVGAALRAGPSLPWILAGTLLVGAGIAVVNVLLPSLIRRDFPGRLGLMTGLYTTAVVGGAAVASAVAVPLMHALGGSWRLALGVWAGLAVLGALAWWPALRGRPARTGLQASGATGVWTNPAALAVTLYMGTQSLVFFTWLTWLPRLLLDHGLGSAEAGALLSLGNVVQLPFTLAVPVLAARLPSARPLVVAISAGFGAGVLGLLAAPNVWPALWVLLLGVASGSAFALALYFIAHRARNASEVPRLSATAQGYGYLLAAAGPVLFGALRDLTGGWTAPLSMLLGVTGLVLLSGWKASSDAAPPR
ncbi:CynX/NimT family MFS transporter [Deinococcus hohokamensis]|uniref:CynX/NimT family MFS transporter n=1 Tax=Deinococcus hohokamensis TaxID=309883 RepID=A0ABV9I4U2_9DEIO